MPSFMPLDNNECLNQNGNCSQNCINTAGSYLCTCLNGYILNINGKMCNGMPK